MAETEWLVVGVAITGTFAVVGLVNQFVLIREVRRLRQRIEQFETNLLDGTLLGGMLEGLGKWLLMRLKDGTFNKSAGTLLAWAGGATGQGLAKVFGFGGGGGNAAPGASDSVTGGFPDEAIPKKWRGVVAVLNMLRGTIAPKAPTAPAAPALPPSPANP